MDDITEWTRELCLNGIRWQKAEPPEDSTYNEMIASCRNRSQNLIDQWTNDLAENAAFTGHHHRGHAPDWSVAVSTSCFHRPWSWASRVYWAWKPKNRIIYIIFVILLLCTSFPCVYTLSSVCLAGCFGEIKMFISPYRLRFFAKVLILFRNFINPGSRTNHTIFLYQKY